VALRSIFESQPNSIADE